MRGFGIEKLALVLLVVLVLFGAKRLPDIGASLGKGIKDFKKNIGGGDDRAPADDATPDDGHARAQAPPAALPRPRDAAQRVEPKRLIG